MSLYQLKNLRKTYQMGDQVVNALDGLDLEIRSNEFLAILGASGSGKSTLMHIIGFMDSPSSGEFFFEGKKANHFSSDQMAAVRSEKIGFIFQSFNLLSQLSVLDNVLLPLGYNRRRIRSARDMAKSAVDRVSLSHRLKHRPSQLSGGERQRVAIARALVINPRLILADEPTGNLDTKNVANILDLFGRIHEEGNTIALVTHDPGVAQRAERIIHMSDGKIVDPDDLPGGA